MAEKVERFSVSLPGCLLRELDGMVQRRGFASRSHAIAEMISHDLAEHRQQLGRETMAGTVTLVFDHRQRDLQKRLAEIQHQHLGLIISNVHVHLDHPLCLEVLLVRGPGASLNKLADELISAHGVRYGRLAIISACQDAEEPADHNHLHYKH